MSPRVNHVDVMHGIFLHVVIRDGAADEQGLVEDAQLRNSDINMLGRGKLGRLGEPLQYLVSPLSRSVINAQRLRRVGVG